MGLLEELANKIAPGSKTFNQNEGLAGTFVPKGYQTNGLTDKEANAIAQMEAIKQRAQDAEVARMIAENRQYNTDRKSAEFTKYPKNLGKYDRVTGTSVGSADAADFQGGADPVTNALAKLQGYLLNKPIDRANEYVDTIDPGLAAKFMESYKGADDAAVRKFAEQAAKEAAIRQANIEATKRQSRNVSPEEAAYMHEYDVGFR